MGEAAMVRRTGWSSMVAERMALPALVLVSGALSASIQLLAGSGVEVGPLLVTVAGLTGLLALLRLMDDLKDLDKDLVAHPDRPLARGALSPRQAEVGVRAGLGGLLAGATALALGGSAPAGGWLALSAVWAFLMYREFFVPDFLASRPVLYAVSHQAILLPMYGFAAAATGGRAASIPQVWWFAATGLGASFTLEVCRKLDPAADPVLSTYRTRLGLGPTLGLALAALVLVGVASTPLGLGPILWPVAGLVVLALAAAALSPGAYRLAGGAAGLLAVVQPMAPLLSHWWRGS